MFISGFTTLLLITTLGVILQKYRFFAAGPMPVEKPNFCCYPNVPSFSNPHVPSSKAISQNQEFFKLPIGMNFLNPHMFFLYLFMVFPYFSMVFPWFSLCFPWFSPCFAWFSSCCPYVFPVFAPLPRAWPGGDPPGSAGGSCGLAMWLPEVVVSSHGGFHYRMGKYMGNILVMISGTNMEDNKLSIL